MMAHALSIAMKKRGIPAVCDYSWYDYNSMHNGAELQRVFGIDEQRNVLLGTLLNSNRLAVRVARKAARVFGLLTLHEASSRRYNFDPAVFDLEDNVVFDQCWTSWKYFNGAELEIRSEFRFPPIADDRNRRIEEAIRCGDSVAIHVRRGDYLTSSVHSGLAPLDYYERGIAHLRERLEGPVFFVFSDDIIWCKAHLDLDRAHYIDWNKGPQSYKDMQLMSYCNNHIIPNSSFSWWGAWLSAAQGKQVIAPLRWANPGFGVEMNDMNLPGWTTLRNFS